jgi:hypothetical protein
MKRPQSVKTTAVSFLCRWFFFLQKVTQQMLSRYHEVLNLQTFLAPHIHCNHHFLLVSFTLSESSIQIGLTLDFLEHFFYDDKVLPNSRGNSSVERKTYAHYFAQKYIFIFFASLNTLL